MSTPDIFDRLGVQPKVQVVIEHILERLANKALESQDQEGKQKEPQELPQGVTIAGRLNDDGLMAIDIEGHIFSVDLKETFDSLANGREVAGTKVHYLGERGSDD